MDNSIFSQLRPGMVVIVTLYHRQLPNNFKTKELGIIQEVDANQHYISIALLTQGLSCDKCIRNTTFLFDTPQRIIHNPHAPTISRVSIFKIEPCETVYLQTMHQALSEYSKEIEKKLIEINNNILHLDMLIKQNHK